MRRTHRAAAQGAFDLNVMSLIDLVFLLLSYFLFTLALTATEGVLPSRIAVGEDASEQVPDEPADDVMVRLVHGADGGVQYFLDNWPLADFGELVERLQRLPAKTLVVIDAAPSVQTAPVVRVYNQCLKLGLKRVVFPVAA